MFFTKWFGYIGTVFILIGLFKKEDEEFDKLHYSVWQESILKEDYLWCGLMCIGCGLMLDFFVWTVFL